MMGTATNVEATAVSTIGWLSAAAATIVVPVYQRQYRWDIGGCEQLLSDIRAVADADDQQRHFLGSILSTADTERGGRDDAELVLIDGQQRVTTLMLLVAALHHTVRSDDPALAAELEKVLVNPAEPTRTKLRPHRAWAGVFESVVLDRRLVDGEPHDSRFDDNYAFFRSQIRAEEAPRIWTGLQKLEHVAISLGADANAQQIFESLNSTGAPLRDHELIHNYLLMGLSHEEQLEIEDSFWVPIEQNTGESIGRFWRHFLVMTTGREVAAGGERGVYDAFRQEFPQLGLDLLRTRAAEWREFSELYRILLDPSLEKDAEIARQLAWVNVFGRGMYPLVMRAYYDYAKGVTDKAALVGTLEHIQSLLLRRAVVGVSTDRLVARMCRAREAGAGSLERAIARITPSDERVRVALKYAELPFAAYVLGRLAGVENADAVGADLEVDHIVPLAPPDTWSGDGVREWADYSEDEQNSHRALAPTLGNLILLEEPLLERALGASFPVKRDTIYAKSAIPATRELAGIRVWSTAAIAERSTRLTEQFIAL